MDSPRNATTARGGPQAVNKPTGRRTVARKSRPWPDAPPVPPEAVGKSGSSYLEAMGIIAAPSESRRGQDNPTRMLGYGEVYGDDGPRRHRRSRLDVFASLAREFRSLVDARELAADDAVRTLARIALGAGVDSEVALAATCVAFLDGRPDRGPGTLDVRHVQVAAIASWWWPELEVMAAC